MLKSLYIFASFISISSFAAVDSKTIKQFKIENSVVKTIVPDQWSPMTDVLNTPLALVSKKGAQNTRAVIQIVPYNEIDKDDFLSKVKKDSNQYYADKESWLGGVNGESIQYYPLEEKSISGGKVFSIGIKYKNEFGEYYDQSFYLSTKTKHLFYVKALTPLDMAEEQTANINRVIASIAEQN